MIRLLLILLLSFGTACDAAEIIAHRGESADAPENTLAAFRLAWERKVQAIELDVHLSRDQQLVICHDADTKRTTGKELVIKESPAAKLYRLDAGSWKDKRFAGETIPSLAAALATIPEGARCFIEIKVGPEAVGPLVDEVRRSGKSPAQLVVISFDAETVAEAKRRLPKLKAFYLCKFKRDEATGQWSPSTSELIATAKRIGADGADVSHEGPIDEAFVRGVRDAGLELYVWTVDDAHIARRMKRLGVDGITTNRAAWMREVLE